MIRTRSSGNKFQDEVKKGVEKLSVPIFPVRLHTTGVRAIADFILFAKDVVILEAKETTAKSFSTKTMQQKEKVEEFQKFYLDAEKLYGNLPYRLFILVHFIAQRKYVTYNLADGLQVLHADDSYCNTFDTLQEALTSIVELGVT